MTLSGDIVSNTYEVKNIEHFPLLIYSVTIYLFIAGTAYTFGAWALFPINIFDYMGVVDIAKSSVPSIMFSFGIASTQIITHLFVNRFSDEVVPVQHSKLTVFLTKHIKIIYVSFLLSFCVSFVFINERPELVIKYDNYIIIILWATVLFSAVLTYLYMVVKGFADELNARKYAIGLTIITLVIIAFACFTIGFTKSVNIINGKKFNYVGYSSEKVSDVKFSVMEKDRYLGFYGGKNFMWDPLSRSVKIVSGDEDIKIKEYRSPRR
ncbi:hypothetical protein WP8S18E02_24560 [Aeromonas hydrophila]|nr:hypothetical protein WP8S18E02_24560 [Aeromonas hydrophila]